MIWIIISLVLFVICILQSYIIWQKVKQVNGYDEVLAQYETWMEEFADTIEKIDEELDRIDSAGTFRSDDEVGYFYQSLYTILKTLNQYGYTKEPEKVTVKYDNEIDAKFFYRDEQIKNRKNKRKSDDVILDDIKKGISSA